MQSTSKILPQQRKRLDRQRFLGLQTQKKLLNSRILITPANGPNTELAKNLVLAGVNITLYDNQIITQDDFQTNFLIALDEVGKRRGEIIFGKLQQMNPSGANQYFDEQLNLNILHQNFLNNYTIVCTSFCDFDIVAKWDNLTKKANKPYYNIFSAGPYAFCYISLGSNYVYRQPPTKKQPRQYTIKCLSLKQSLDKSQVIKSKKKQHNLLQAIIMMKQSQDTGLNYDIYNTMKMHEEMLNCMVDIGEEIKQEIQRQFLITFAKCFGLEYCPVYSVIGSIVSQQIIKVVQNQQEPGMNWIVMNSEEGYACVLKLKKQEQRITSQVFQVKKQQSQ